MLISVEENPSSKFSCSLHLYSHSLGIHLKGVTSPESPQAVEQCFVLSFRIQSTRHFSSQTPHFSKDIASTQPWLTRTQHTDSTEGRKRPSCQNVANTERASISQGRLNMGVSFSTCCLLMRPRCVPVEVLTSCEGCAFHLCSLPR